MLAFALIFGAGLVGPTSAYATSCAGNSCTGRDPVSSGCSAGAVTVAHVQLPAVSQRLELRWSPSCQTNWARMVYDPDPAWLHAFQPQSLYVAQKSGSDGTNSWTAMIYSPNYCVNATVETRIWGWYQTACV
jgi:hypothetical protein